MDMVNKRILSRVNKQQKKFLLRMTSLYKTCSNLGSLCDLWWCPDNGFISDWKKGYCQRVRLAGDLASLKKVTLLQNNLPESIIYWLNKIFKEHINQVIVAKWQRRRDINATGRQTYEFLSGVSERLKIKNMKFFLAIHHMNKLQNHENNKIKNLLNVSIEPAD